MSTTEPTPARIRRKATPAPDPAVEKPRRQRQEITSEIVEPPGGVDYTRVLSGPPQRAATSAGGLIAVLFTYILAMPLLYSGFLGIGYLLRGRPGSFEEYRTAAGGYEYWEGMLAWHLTLAALVVVTLLLVRFMHQRPQSYLSSVQPGLRWRYLLVVAAISIVVMNAFYWLTTGRTEFEYNPQDNLVGWLILILLTTPLQAAGEEYLFRGYLTQALGSFINQKWVVILISGVLFSLFHGYQDLPLFINRAAFGILMGVLVVLTGGLEAAIAAHAVNNVFAFAYAALDGGVAATKALTSITWTAMAWNLATYAVVGLLAWAVGRAMKVATLTPKVAAATGRH